MNDNASPLAGDDKNPDIEQPDSPKNDRNGQDVQEQDRPPPVGWFQRLMNTLLGHLTDTSLRSQMEGALADDGAGDETISAEEKAMLRNVLALREMRVDDVMVPRAEIDAVEDDISLEALLAVYQKIGHSRLPVYRETLDDPVGMVHIKDLLGFMTRQSGISSGDEDQPLPSDLSDQDQKAMKDDETSDLSNHSANFTNIDLQQPLKDLGVIRDILFVPPSMPAIDLMAQMRAARTQMALVIDEYGGTDGLISLEDVVETVVGDIEDEHDDEEQVVIAEVSANLFIADAKANLEEVQEAIGKALPLDDDSMEDVDTLGGFLFTHLGRIPVRGELIAVPGGLEFEIMDADARRIRRVKVRLRPTKKTIKKALASKSDDQPSIAGEEK